MRMIEFRGKSLETGRWLFGSLLTGYFVMRTGVPECLILDASVCPDYDSYEDLITFELELEVDPETVGQRIDRVFAHGDEDGGPIYRGDIVEFACEGKDIVGWVEVEFGIPIIVSRCLEDGFIYLSEILKVDEDQAQFEGQLLGNKWDNPELLGV